MYGEYMKIGNIEIKNKTVLAPMAGISNPAFIKICEEMGVGYAVTELISSEAIVRKNKKTFEMLNGIDKLNIPVGVQLFGSNPEIMAKAAKILTDNFDIKIIDINMGCPVPKVAVRSKAGSALLKDIDKIKGIVSRVKESVNIPVTVKIRSGWDFDSINAVEVAKACEESGASSICIHPRTRSQGYSGKSDWSIIKQVKDNVSIPVIGNGDIKTVYDAKEMLDTTGCDFIMIGRALLGNPWLIKQINTYLSDGIILDNPTYDDRINMCIKHLNNLALLKNEKSAILEIRNHISWYLKGMPNANEIKNKIFIQTNIFDIINILNQYKNDIDNLES